MGGRPGEVRAGWLAKQIGRHVKTVRAWCRVNEVECRAEYGRRREDGLRHVIQYWISKEDAERIVKEIRG